MTRKLAPLPFGLLLAGITLAAGAALVGGCGGESPAAAADAGADSASDVGGEGDAGPADATQDAEGDTADDVTGDAAGDAIGDVEADAGGTERLWQYRAIGGISMGAAAANISLANPGTFDVVGALGGYIDHPYLVHAGVRLQLGGFCPLATLEAHPDALNDPGAEPPIFCGPGKTLEELEFSQDFNHLHYDTNGADFHRGFYLRVFQALTMAFGNFMAEPTGATPYLPTGLADDWVSGHSEAERCGGDGPAIDASLAYNAEYNPTGTHAVIPFCDGYEQVTPDLGGADYDPAAPHTHPYDIGLVVDINDNGVRDYGEPLFLNPWERFEDAGADGCFNAREDGAGGCLPPGTADATGDDPNGDDYHWWDNPDGTENDERHEEGEYFVDAGLDGVPGTGDRGEDNGQWDTTTAMERAVGYGARDTMLAIDDEALANMDFYFDSGIRDPLHAAVSTRHVVGVLQERMGDVSLYQGIAGRPGSLFPNESLDNLPNVLLDQDLSAKALGRNIYVEYGDPNATPEELAAGDGGHVGTNAQALNRILVFMVLAIQRFPHPDLTPGAQTTLPYGEVHSFYSEGLKARRNYSIALPPGYKSDDYADARFPVLYFLHGLGQTAADLAPIGIVTSSFMQDGGLAKAIVVLPDGACCKIHTPTGRRECACTKAADGFMDCVDPACQGAEETCEVRKIPKSELTEECNEGSLFLNLVSNRFGEPRDDMNYADSVIELVHEVDARYRTRGPETVTGP